MSDFRFAGRWLNDRRVMTLCGDDFKGFVTAGAWMVENRTDGVITPDDLDFVPRFDRSIIPRLIIAGLWEEQGDAWIMLDYQGSQTSRAEFETLEKARRADREKKARLRAHKAGDHSLCGETCSESKPTFTNPQSGLSPGHVPGTTQARLGKARQGKDSGSSLDSWPTAIPGEPDTWGDPTAPGTHLRAVQ